MVGLYEIFYKFQYVRNRIFNHSKKLLSQEIKLNSLKLSESVLTHIWIRHFKKDDFYSRDAFNRLPMGTPFLSEMVSRIFFLDLKNE